MKAPCLLCTAVNEVTVGTTDIPEPGPGELWVETLYSAVSPGTELRCLSGKQDGLGTDGFPFIPGYAMVGRVVRGSAPEFPPGALVFCRGTQRASHRLSWGGHVGLAVVVATNALLLPAGVDPVEASLIRLAAIALRGVVMARPQPHQSVAVVGLGPIGQLAARLFRNTGARVVATDLSAARVATARNAGVEAVPAAGDVNAAVRRVFPDGADIVVDATGHPKALADCAKLVRDRPWADDLPESGKLVVQGSYAGEVGFPHVEAFVKELQVFWPRDCQRGDLEVVAQHLVDGRLRMRDLAGEALPISQAPGAYRALANQTAPALTAVFEWNQPSTGRA